MPADRRLEARLADAGLALAQMLVLAVVIATDSQPSVWAALMAAGFGALLLARRHVPRVVLVVTVLGIFGYYTLNLAPVGMVLPAIGALFSAAEQRRTGWAAGSAAVLLAVAIWFRLAGDDDPAGRIQGYSVVTEIALAAAAIALGAAVRLGREARGSTARIAELTRAQARHAAAARRQAERLQIARDLHDTIGHSLSVAALHAGVAAEASGQEEVSTAVRRVREASGEALAQLRRTVWLLRQDSSSDSQPGLAAAPEVLERARSAGLRVSADVDVLPLPPSVDAAAYRILQEAVTNVLRHARAGTLEVSAQIRGGEVVLRIADDGGAGEDWEPGAGIRGMTERAQLLGGSLRAGGSPAGFEVRARLPVDTVRP